MENDELRQRTDCVKLLRHYTIEYPLWCKGKSYTSDGGLPYESAFNDMR